ncbi:ketoacyl-ACP synthase III [Streptomyces sp. G3]|uniref:3-oxoacyl-ACP synthase III family protein n=1 Tax=Streptomyces TaxID=1883 RepID=UPI002030D1CA|nr:MULTISPECIES: ketoacyl-ACP synthase III [Streptomyces]MCM1942095.1 ketoacyl-ACP synthase III [Streptomyces sp. G3]MCQ4204476.1 ketoacyl-ACP synthase III [Streptomyces coelicoflavus]WSU01149.1 ketoacyl-ACP synthase III [Streptomyces sp. NBC_01124]
MISTGTARHGRTSGSIAVLGTGSCLPSHVVGNDEVGAAAGVTDEWIRRKTGITARRRAKPDEATSDLAIAAGRAAMEAAGITAADLSLIVVATSTPDQPQPPTASIVADGLGAGHGAAAFDVNAVCSGFVFALNTAQHVLAGSDSPYALVIGADVYSRILDPADRRTAILFGDGAGAVVLGPARPGRGLLASRLAGFGAERDLIEVPAGGSRRPTTPETLAAGLQYFHMNGRGVRDFVTEVVTPAIGAFVDDAGFTPADIDHFVPHQANGRMLDDLSATLGIGAGRTHFTYEDFGNTGSASVPVTLDHAARSGRLADGDLVLLAAFGGGMAMGLSLLRWQHPLPTHTAPTGYTHTTPFC